MPRTKRILIIDDEPDFHSLFSRVLTAEGYQVISVHSGEEALERLMYNNFDLIILDLVLPPPGRSGIETLEAIRKINTETCVIITSAYATTEHAVEAVMEKGAQTYIRKPFNIENVRQIVKNGLRWRKGSLPAADHDVNVALEWRRQSIMKRCFLTGLPHCPWKIQEHDKTVFVGMPFIDKGELVFNDVYQNSIKPAVSQLGLDVWRADENMSNVVIMCKICQGIQKSRYAIIDISDWNSNVLFEFGLVCGLGKRAVLLKNKMSAVPTNLRGLEYISYENDFEQLKIKIVENLGKIVAKSIPQKDRR
jgi:CheY-like chemotaxis protein